MSLVLILSFFILTPRAIANHKQLVLGESTPASQLTFPAVSSGPGLILPDSPLFFLDELKQQVRGFLAFTPEAKARLHADIAGERLAELRVMMSRNNQDAINETLSRLTSEVNASSINLSDAAARGTKMQKFAEDFNDAIKSERKILSDLSDQSTGVLKLQLLAANKALREAKVGVEDQLSEGQLKKEIQENLAEDISEGVKDAGSSASNLERELNELQFQASDAAKKSLDVREAALRKAIEEKNTKLQKEEEKLIASEKKKQDTLLATQTKAISEARESIQKAQEAANRFRQAKQEVQDLQSQSVSGASTSKSL